MMSDLIAHDDYQNASSGGSAWLESDKGDCNLRMLRGGSWGVRPRYLRSANRGWIDPDEWYNDLGFRLAQDP